MSPIDRIDELLVKQGKTRQDLANAVGITTSAISTWKKRNSVPLADTAIKIADYLNVSAKYLLTGVNETLHEDPEINECIQKIVSMSPEKRKLTFEIINSINNYPD